MLLGTDLPAMAVINLRAVQLIAMTYSFEVNTPFEMMTALKVFHAATLPARLQGQAWEDLMADLEKVNDYYFYEGKEELTNVTWLEHPLKQVLKGILILLFKNRSVQGIPLSAWQSGLE